MFVTSPISTAFHRHGFGRQFELACLVWLVPAARAPLLAELLEAMPGAKLITVASLLGLARRHLAGEAP